MLLGRSVICHGRYVTDGKISIRASSLTRVDKRQIVYETKGGVTLVIEDMEKVEKAKIILHKIANGINPVTGGRIEEDSFLNDPRIIRCFYFVTEILENVRNGKYRHNRDKLTKFIITQEQKEKVQFPLNNIGVNEFAKSINACIDLGMSKKLNGTELNKKLKTLGILGEEGLETGNKRTVINQNSFNYGFESERRSYNGSEYDMVVINDKGKKYLLENIETIMSTESVEI